MKPLIVMLVLLVATVAAAQDVCLAPTGVSALSDTQRGIVLAAQYASVESDVKFASVTRMTGDVVNVELMRLETSAPALQLSEVLAYMYKQGYRPAALWECMPVSDELLLALPAPSGKGATKAFATLGTVAYLNWRDDKPGVADGSIFVFEEGKFNAVSRKDTLWKGGDHFAVVKIPKREREIE